MFGFDCLDNKYNKIINISLFFSHPLKKKKNYVSGEHQGLKCHLEIR